MRIASRIVGALLALAGLGFLALAIGLFIFGFDRGSVLTETSHRSTWISGSFALALSIGFLLAGKHFWMFDVDEAPDLSRWRYAPYVLAHRRQFKVIAQVGLLISVIHLVAALARMDWPGPWVTAPLFLAAAGLWAVSGRVSVPNAIDYLDWNNVPEWMQPALKLALQAGQAALVVLVLLLFWNAWSHHPVSPPAIVPGLIVLAFAWEVLFFTYGEISMDQARSNALKS